MKYLIKSYPKHPKNYCKMELDPHWAEIGKIPFISLKDLAELKIAEIYGSSRPYQIIEEWIDTSEKDGFYFPKFGGSLKIPLGTLNYYVEIQDLNEMAY